MSTTIEREIVQMVFDGKGFQKGVQSSIHDIENLKKTINFDSAEHSFAELENASKVDFSVMENSLASLNNKVSLTGVLVADTVVKIAGAIQNAARSVADTLILGPMTQGLDEYETQLNAIQTILANTKIHGTELEDVTEALDELNTYADLTIYNFTQMVDSIGKFTTAGVELDTSVGAIKGIANVAALSGSSAVQASTAMYQLSQAISSGIVRLQDWMSIENAGMGGQIFRDSLMETARAHGVSVDAMVEKNGSFRSSLQENWLTSEIMLDTLNKFTGDMDAAELAAQGYTDEQIASIQELAVMANDAATKVKTFTQLKDTMAEAMGSGWAKTWSIVLGDFEQAKKLWGRAADFFGGFIEASSEARNKQLAFWSAAGGREQLIEGIFNVLQTLANVLGIVKDAFTDVFGSVKAGDLIVLTRQFFNFSETLKNNVYSMYQFSNVIKGVVSIFGILFLILKAILKPIVAFIKTLSPGAGSLLDMASNMGLAIDNFRKFAEETGYFDKIVSDVIDIVGNFISKIKEIIDTFLGFSVVQQVVAWLRLLGDVDFIKLWNDIIDLVVDFIQQVDELVDSLLKLEIIQDIIELLKALTNIDLGKVWSAIVTGVKIIITPFYLLAKAAAALYKWLSELKIVRDIVNWFKELKWSEIKDAFWGMAHSAKDFMSAIKKSELLGKFVEYLKTFDGRRLTKFFEDAKISFSWFTGIIDKLKESFGGLSVETNDLGGSLDGVFDSIREGLGEILDYLIEHAGSVDYTKVFDKIFDFINKGLIAAVLLSLRKLISSSGFNLTEAFESILGSGSSFGGIGESITNMFGTLEGTLSAFQNNIKADTLQKIAIAIALLAGSIALLTFIDSEKLLAATAAIAAMTATLFGGAGALSLIKTQDALKASAVIVALSVALGIASIALKNVSDLDPKAIEQGLIAMGGALASLVISMNALRVGTGLVKTVGLLLALSTSLLILGVAIRKFGEMDPDVLAQGLASVGAALALVVSAMLLISKAGDKGMLKAALAITDMAFALNILAGAVNKFGKMDEKVLKQGMTSAALALAGFAGFSQIIKPEGMIKAGVGITIMAAALLVMYMAVKNFASISWEELLRGLVGMGGALLLLVIAAQAMSGALAGAAAMLIMSIAVAALSVALKLLSTLSWSELAIALVALAGVFVVLGLAGYLLAPVVPVLLLLGVAMLLIGAAAALLGVGLLAAATGLIALGGSAAVVAGGIAIIGAAIIEILPKVAEAIAKAIASFLATIAENMPVIIESMKTIILGMIGAIVELIPEIVIAIGDLLLAVLQAVAERLPDLVQAGFDILLAFIKGIEDNIADVVSAGLGVLTEFMAGIEEGIPDLIDQAFSLILTFLEAIADAIEEYFPQIVEAGIRIGEAIVDGLVEAIHLGLGAVKDAVFALAKAALEALGLGFLMGSPSKKTYEIGYQVVRGFLLAIRDGISKTKKVMDEFATEAKDGLDPIVRAIAGEIDRGIEFSPVITPVLDLDNVSKGVGSINRSLTNAKVLASLTYSDQERNRQNGSNSLFGHEEQGSVTYIQNNYSPKALDRETIYRQTRTQVATLSRRALEK